MCVTYILFLYFFKMPRQAKLLVYYHGSNGDDICERIDFSIIDGRVLTMFK
jgi:hypothetical protein